MQFRAECDLNKKGCDSWINHAAESQSDRKDHQWFQNGCNKGLYHCLTLFIVYKIIVTVNCPASIIVFSTVWLTLYLCVQQYSCCAIGSRDRSLSVWVSWYDDHLGISSLLSFIHSWEFYKQQRFWATHVNRKWTFFAILGHDFDQISGRIISLREKTLRNLLLIVSGHIKREKDLVLVDIRRQKNSPMLSLLA